MFRHRRRREGLGLLLLIGQLMRVGFDRIPPTTLGTIAINVAIYLKVLDPYIRMYFRSPTIKNVCASTYSVWYQGDWPRLATAAWFHLDDWHLYFNMVSFLWKGLSLERRFGTAYFMYLIAVFSLLTNALMIGLNMALAEVLNDDSYIVSCAAGFSGVIFALKILTTHYTPAGTQYVMGFPVPSRYACWAELVLIQLLVPRASFTGHLAGILVGMAYVKGPLKSILDIVPSILTPRRGFQGTGRPGRGSYSYRSGTTGRGEATGAPPRGGATGAPPRGGATGAPPRGEATGAPPRGGATGAPPRGGATGAPPRGYEYAGGMDEEEQMQEAIRASLQTGGNRHPSAPTPSAPPYKERPNGPRLYPDLGDLSQDMGQRSQGPGHLNDDELRRRRLARLDR